ncbi:hypothetical protein FDP41_011071 [Naegleria fowleri]|uniref:tRNAHis guanylyltransferase catalytic domain-containing protein n=1 Tax=Naegleria fowleri TaxID=5763 RepID=A0A6A5BY92_NAEFO|nr:uncharacterized protein FDP41_011071 [Naegleria fowleri]KAF0983093.1 hypothetical protein FDP41_011071 [Naegleria fowleri]
MLANIEKTVHEEDHLSSSLVVAAGHSESTTPLTTTTTTSTFDEEQDETSSIPPNDQRKGHKGVFIEIGERMKNYEKNQGPFLSLDKPFMARLDGHKFSSFSYPFRKPYDDLLHAVMVQTAADLLEEFTEATCAYTQSDEITLTFPNEVQVVGVVAGSADHDLIQDDKDNQYEKSSEMLLKNRIQPQQQQPRPKSIAFGGKVTKWSTLLASYCSVRFNFNCQQLVPLWPTKEEYVEKQCPANQTRKSYSPEAVQNMLKRGKAYFDARLFQVDSTQEFVNNIRWRSNYDCERNSRTNLGACFFSTKEMNGLRASQVVEKLKTEKQIDWNSYPMGFKYGTFIKKSKYEKTVHVEKTNQTMTCTRTKMDAYSFKLDSFDPKYIQLFTLKTWNEVFEAGILNKENLEQEPLFRDLLSDSMK